MHAHRCSVMTEIFVWGLNIQHTQQEDTYLPRTVKDFATSNTYSGPSSYDRPDIRTTWVTTKDYACAVVNKDPKCVSLSPDTRVCGRTFGQCSALYN
jgi:hypothetical protein